MEEKKAYAEQVFSVRALVDFLNKKGIKKGDLFTIVNVGESFIVIYYA